MVTKRDQTDYIVTREQETQAWWEQERIFEKLKTQNLNGPVWSFLDGPITANNPMGVHHAWGRTYKDCFQRFHAMSGHRLRYQNGFDCQGLWVEVEVEKELGFKTKRDIETFGVAAFVQKCKDRVIHFSQQQTQQSIRLGYWMDWENSYYTMSDRNNYAIWSFLKKCHDQGYIYKGRDCMPWCPRCATGISHHEMHEGYKTVTDNAVYVRLPIVQRSGEYLLVWTTTPWTLVANVACAVNPDLMYARVKQADSVYYIASDRTAVLQSQGDYAILETLRGEELVDMRYHGPFDDSEALAQVAGLHRTVAWKDVTADEGTGIVHIAPGCGKEDFTLGTREQLPVLSPVDEYGVYYKEYGDFGGKYALSATEQILSRLYATGVLYNQESYEHSYPHCWRCGTALLFRTVHEWFIRMDWRDWIKRSAAQAQWIPAWGLARELEWLDSMDDWMISKKRYWGLALPIYECECGWFDVMGSKEELRSRAVEGWNAFDGNSPHRPWIDHVKISCMNCGNLVARIPDVGNPWLDAGIVAYATQDQRNGASQSEWIPADLVIECFPGQVRNWFYALLAMSTMLQNQSCFKTLFGHGLVKDAAGEEMHKSKGNAILFDDAAQQVGADSLRWVFCHQNPADNLHFSIDAARQVHRTVFNTWHNIDAFFNTYAKLDGFTASEEKIPVHKRPDMDRWIVSELHTYLTIARRCMEIYDVSSVVKAAEQFIDSLSNWYIRRNRRRFWREQRTGDYDKLCAYQTLYEVLSALSQSLAPVVPFMTEAMYRGLVSTVADTSAPQSVHLCRYPTADPSLIDTNLSFQMNEVMAFVSAVLNLRQTHQLRVRQPLGWLMVECNAASSVVTLDQFKASILEETNIKQLDIRLAIESDNVPACQTLKTAVTVQTQDWTITMDTALSDELLFEGAARDIVRHIQTLRKECGYAMDDRIDVFYHTSATIIEKMFRQWHEFIKTETLARTIEKINESHVLKKCRIHGQTVGLTIKKYESSGILKDEHNTGDVTPLS
ncbi:MAG: isoleucine--tRNA ligase [Chitinivibrionales bacterium]|nr:isoleucine--tRNA ligase [Chitinivibrionales bacterium]